MFYVLLNTKLRNYLKVQMSDLFEHLVHLLLDSIVNISISTLFCGATKLYTENFENQDYCIWFVYAIFFLNLCSSNSSKNSSGEERLRHRLARNWCVLFVRLRVRPAKSRLSSMTRYIIILSSNLVTLELLEKYSSETPKKSKTYKTSGNSINCVIVSCTSSKAEMNRCSKKKLVDTKEFARDLSNKWRSKRVFFREDFTRNRKARNKEKTFDLQKHFYILHWLSG